VIGFFEPYFPDAVKVTLIETVTNLDVTAKTDLSQTIAVGSGN